jgi:hypothetical protein
MFRWEVGGGFGVEAKGSKREPEIQSFHRKHKQHLSWGIRAQVFILDMLAISVPNLEGNFTQVLTVHPSSPLLPLLLVPHLTLHIDVMGHVSSVEMENTRARPVNLVLRVVSEASRGKGRVRGRRIEAKAQAPELLCLNHSSSHSHLPQGEEDEAKAQAPG